MGTLSVWPSMHIFRSGYFSNTSHNIFKVSMPSLLRESVPERNKIAFGKVIWVLPSTFCNDIFLLFYLVENMDQVIEKALT
jgi:hypothetical protein